MIRFIAGAAVFVVAANYLLPDTHPSNATPRALEISANANGEYRTECAINSISMQCLIDTGASGVALDRRAAAMIGINVARLRFSGRSETANGTARIACGLAVTLKVGPLTHAGFPVCVINSDMHGIPLLGTTFLRMHHIEMDNETMTISD